MSVGASGRVGDTVRGGGASVGGTCEKNKTGSTARGGIPPAEETPLFSANSQEGAPGLVEHVSFLCKKTRKKKKRPRQLPSSASPQISRRFLSCSQQILTFFSIPSSPSRGISCRDVTSAPRSAVPLTHSHAHLLESIHDRKSAVSHLRNCRQVLSLPPCLPPSLSFDTMRSTAGL